MSLAQLFYLKETFRERMRRWRRRGLRDRTSFVTRQSAGGWNSARSAQHSGLSTQHFTLEPLEPRLLLSATPIEAIQQEAVLEPAAVTVPHGNLPSLDVDLNGQADALTDGILIIRHLFGFTGAALTNGAVDPTGRRTDPTAIQNYLNSISTALDVDLNTQADALTDGILIIRSLFGFTGTALTDGAIDPAGQRTDPTAIATFLDNMNPQREQVAPLVIVGLLQDTGASVTDGITSNPAITGTIADINPIVSFTAGFDATPLANFIDILSDLQSDGTFGLSTLRLADIFGSALADGAHTLHLRVTDARGNLAAVNLTVTLDTTAPSLTAGLANDTGQSNVDSITFDPTISGQVTDESGIVSLLAGFDNAAPGSFTDVLADLGTNGTFTWQQARLNQINGAPLAQGVHTLHLRTVDRAGNERSVDVTFTFDTVAPPLSAALANDTGVSATDLLTFDPTIAGSATDLFGIGGLQAGFDATPLGSFTDILPDRNPDGTFTLSPVRLDQINGGPLAQGGHTLHLRAQDIAGNQSLFDVPLTLDTIQPTVVSTPTGNYTETFASFDVVFSEAMGPAAFELGSYSLVVVGGPDDGKVVTLESVQRINDTTARISVAKALAEETYRLIISPALIDLAGNTLAQPNTFEFALVHPTTVIRWINAAGGFWDVASNWDLGRVPVLTDNVVIDLTGAFTVTHRNGSTDVHSLTLGNNLTLSMLAGTGIKAHNEASIAGIINANGGNFTAAGPEVVFAGNRARVFASNGAQVIICAPEYSSAGLGGGVTLFSVAGPGTVLDLSLVASLDAGFTDGNGSLRALHTISVTGGGRLNLSGLRTVNAPLLVEDGLVFSVDGTTSRLDLSGLTRIDAAGGNTQFVVANGAVVDLPSIQTLGDVSFSVTSGARLNVTGAAPAVYSTTGFDSTSGMTVAGAGSVLDLSSVIGLTASSTGAVNGLEIQALNGGQVILGGATSIVVPQGGNVNNGYLRIVADGNGSSALLGNLTTLSDPGVSTPSQLEVRNGGVIATPNVGALDGVNLIIETGGTINTTQLTTITNATITVNGGTSAFPDVTNLDGTGVNVSGGVTVGFPSLTSMTHTAPVARTWQASGVGSVLDLSALVTLTGSTAGSVGLTIAALDGGQVDLSNTTTIAVPLSAAVNNGLLQMIADGIGSVVDLARLVDFTDAGSTTPSRVEAKNSGTVTMPNVTLLDGVDVAVGAGGTLNTAQLMTITNATVIINGGRAAFPNVTNLDGTGVNVSGGVTVGFPSLTSMTHTAPVARTWQASGAGSMLDLSALGTFKGSTAGAVGFSITALNGGLVNLSGVSTIAIPTGQSVVGRIFITADGANSLIDLAGLTTFSGATDLTHSSFDVRNGGEINIPTLAVLDAIDLTIGTGGTIDTAQLTAINNATLALFSGNLLFPLVTAVDGTSILVSSGVAVEFSGVTNYTVRGTRDVTWRATGAGSSLAMGNLTAIVGSTVSGRDLFIEATAGGLLDLNRVATLTVPGTGFNGTIQVMADGAGSVVDLTDASSFIDNGANTLSRLEQRNGGDIFAPNLTTLVNVTVVGGPLSISSAEPASGLTPAPSDVFSPRSGALAYVQKSWVEEFVSDGASLGEEDEDEELLIALPG
jgi:hypothetical protein